MLSINYFCTTAFPFRLLRQTFLRSVNDIEDGAKEERRNGQKPKANPKRISLT